MADAPLVETETLKSLLEAQAKAATVIDDKDDARTITKKLLKARGEREPNATSWSSAAPGVVQCPTMWFFLLTTEAGQAVIAINGYLHSFAQRHLVDQIATLVLAMAASVALTKKLDTPTSLYEAFTICEPLLTVVTQMLHYLQAKRLGAERGVNPARLLSAVEHPTDSFLSRMETAAQKMRGGGGDDRDKGRRYDRNDRHYRKRDRSMDW